MNTLGRFAISYTLLLAVSQPVLAVQPGGQIAPSPSTVNTTGNIERGGTVNAIDLQKKTIVVDGVSYPISAGSVKIHTLSNKTSERISELKAGMQIRFSSSKDNWSRQEQVREIWVTSPARNQPRQ